MTTARTVAPNHGGRANTRGRAVVASCIYGCTKLQASIADAGSIPDSGIELPLEGGVCRSIESRTDWIC